MNKILAASLGILVILVVVKLVAPTVTGAASVDNQMRYVTIKAPLETSVAAGQWLREGDSGGVTVYSGTFTGKRIVGYARSDAALGGKNTQVEIVLQAVEQLPVMAGDYRFGQMLALFPDSSGTHAILGPGGGIREVAMSAETAHVDEGGKLLVYVNMPTTRIQ